MAPKKIRWPLGFLLCLTVFGLSAQAGLRFIENKGQWPTNVTHRAELSGATIWCEHGSILIDLYDNELIRQRHANMNADPFDTPPLQHHAVRLRFLNAHSAVTRSLDQQPGHSSYFIGNDRTKWAGGARSFAAISMKEIAPGCDAIIREGRAGLKYDLILAPGADPAGIQFTYDGAETMALRDGALIVTTSLGRMIERIPVAYQDIDGERSYVTCRYTVSNNAVGIAVEAYDPNYELVIDPTLEFATYSGSFSDNFGYTATFDNAGFLYSGSTAFGAQYPVTIGAYQTEWGGGGTDIAISKYDTTGSFMVWSTYLGGSGSEMPHSLIVDNNDQLMILGTTGSADFPITNGAFDPVFNGGPALTLAGLQITFGSGADIIVARLNSNGTALLGSTFLGGTGNDGLNNAIGLKFNYADEVRGEVLLDEDGKVWIATTTQSTDMPVSANAAQPTHAGGSHDGYVARFDQLLTQLEYGSYLGGSAADAIYSAEIDQQGRLFVCGGTLSEDLPASQDAVVGGPIGATDGFVARFSADGNSVERLSYWGSPEYDQAYLLQLDSEGSVFMFGQTSAVDEQAMIFNSAYSQPAGGQFITKLDPDLANALMSTRIGSGDGDPDISPTAFLVDVCDKIYISGWGSNLGSGAVLSTDSLPITADAHQSTTDGHDLYLAVFDINMSALTYATYYGGADSREHVDGGTSRFDRRGRIYQTVCAGCGNNDDFPTTPGAWSATNNSNNCNSAVVKFDFDAPLVSAAFLAPDTACSDGTIPFTNLSSSATGQLWDFGDGNTSQEHSPTHVYSGEGAFTVWLTVFDPATCNEIDSVSRTIIIEHAIPDLEVMNDTLICGPVDAFTLSATGTADQYIWSSSAMFSDTLNADLLETFAVIAPAVGGTFHIRAGRSNVCSAQDSVTVIIQLANPHLTGDSLLCLGDPATLLITGVEENYTIIWSPADEIVSGQGTTQAITIPSESLVFGVEVETPEGCSWSGTIGVEVSPVESSSITAFVDQPLVIAGTTVQLTATPTNVTYSWTPADLVSDATIANPTAVIDQTTTFTVTISDGICTKDASVTVRVYELVCDDPDIFVPNTFTPNADGNNDVLFVRARHITDLDFQIFNRWGEKVFETRDQRIGWDGTYKGMAVDPAVFVYHLTAYCLDGQRYFTKGNVTVVR